MSGVTEAFVGKFAEDLSEAITVREQVIAERNLVLASCMFACETRQPQAAKTIYLQALEDSGAQPSGFLDTDNWLQCVRTTASNAYPISTDDDEILATISTGNPYFDIARASHPSARKV